MNLPYFKLDPAWFDSLGNLGLDLFRICGPRAFDTAQTNLQLELQYTSPHVLQRTCECWGKKNVHGFRLHGQVFPASVL